MVEAGFVALLGELGDLVGQKDLVPDETGGLVLSFEEKLSVNVQFDPNVRQVILFSPIVEYEDAIPESVKDILLEADLFSQGTGGATLGVDFKDQLVVLSRRFFLEKLTARDLLGQLELFAGEALRWRDLLERKTEESVFENQNFGKRVLGENEKSPQVELNTKIQN